MSLVAVGSFTLALGAIGCWGDVVPVYPDAGGDAGTDTDTGPAEPSFYAGGGTGGGPIDGVVNLYLFDEVSGEGIEGARVMLGDDPDAALTGTTDADGLVVFEDASLTGAVNLHALADGYSAESYLGLGASNATFALRPLDFPSTPSDPATLSGTVDGFGNIPDPGTGEYKVVAVMFGPPIDASLDDRDPQLEPVTEAEVVQVDTASYDFSIEVPPGAGVLYALGGLHVVNEDEQEVYEWTNMGIVAGLEPTPGEELDGLEITLDTQLLIDFRAYLSLLPSIYEVKRVALGLDLDQQGVVWFLGRPSATQTVFVAPGLDGDLADGGVFLMALGDQVYDAVDADDLLATTPRARRYEHGLEDFFGYSTGPYIFDAVGSPPAQLGWDGAQFTCFPTSGTSMAVVSIQGAEDGVQSWRATVFGELPDTLPAPLFPADWGWEGAPANGVVVRAWTVMVDADVNNIDFGNFHTYVRDTAENATLVE
jgi:hypothetical protein